MPNISPPGFGLTATPPGTGPVAVPVPYASSLLVEELADSGPGRKLTLTGGGLPFMGAPWGGKLVAPTTWYPGNGDEATQQVLGPQEIPSSWQGDWRLTVLTRAPCTFNGGGSDSTVTEPFTLWQICEDFFRRGRRLRVTWSVVGAASGKVVREGRCTEWNFKPSRIQDIEWDMTWTWVGRGARIQRVVSTRDDNSQTPAVAFTESVNDLAALVTSAPLISANPSVSLSATSFSLGQLAALVNAPLALVNGLKRSLLRIQTQVQAVADIASAVQNLPAALSQSATDACRDVRQQCAQIQQQLGATPPEQLTTQDKVSDVARAVNYYSSVRDGVQKVQQAAQAVITASKQVQADAPLGGKHRAEDRRLRVADVQQKYVAVQGDTPQRVSSRMFATPDHADLILRANRLPLTTPSFVPGTVLVIPRLPSQKQGV